MTYPTYGTAGSVTITLSGLTTDSNLLAGRQSASVDNTSNLAATEQLLVRVDTSSTPTANTQIEIWLAGSLNGTDFAGGLSGSDAAASLATLGVKQTMALAGVIAQTDTTARAYRRYIDVAAAFGGNPPPYYSVYVVHNTGQNLGASSAITRRPLTV